MSFPMNYTVTCLSDKDTQESLVFFYTVQTLNTIRTTWDTNGLHQIRMFCMVCYWTVEDYRKYLVTIFDCIWICTTDYPSLSQMRPLGGKTLSR